MASIYQYNTFIPATSSISIPSSKKHVQKKMRNDFLPTDFHAGLTALCINTNNVVFLPDNEDKLYLIMYLLRSVTGEVLRSEEKILYLIDNPIWACQIKNCLHKYVPLKVAYISNAISENDLQIMCGNNHVLIITCELNSSMTDFYKKFLPSLKLRLVIFDDCIHGLDDSPMKQIADVLVSSKSSGCPIIGLTSILLGADIRPDDLYHHFKKLEKQYKANFICSSYCKDIKKYLTDPTITLVRYNSADENLYSTETFEEIHSVLDDCKYIIGNAKISDPEVKAELQSIVSNIKYFIGFGAYPLCIFMSACRVRLERLKLKYSNDSSVIAIILTTICDLNVICALIAQYEKIDGLNDNIKEIIENSNNKLQKLLSLLLKINYKDRCVILVRDQHTAQVVTHFIQKVSFLYPNMNQIRCANFIDSNYSYFNEFREKMVNHKKMISMLKKYHSSDLNVLVTSWEYFVNTCNLNSTFIMYFDIPPNFECYFKSQKLGNPEGNKHYFFLEDDGTGDLKIQLEPFSRFNSIMKEILEKKDIMNLSEMMRTYRKMRSNKSSQSWELSPLITNAGKICDTSNAICILNKLCITLPHDAFSIPAPHWRIVKEKTGIVGEIHLPIQCCIKNTVRSAPMTDAKLLKPSVALQALKLLHKNGLLNDNLSSTARRIDLSLLNDQSVYPYWRPKEDGIHAGSSEVCRIVPISFPQWFRKIPTTTYYVHVIHIEPKFPFPEQSRKRRFYDLLKAKKTFGIVTNSTLPEICRFPVFIDLGEVEISVEVNAFQCSLSKNDFDKIRSFHRFVYVEVLEAVKDFMVTSDENEDNFYCLAPVETSDSGKLKFDWYTINNLSQHVEMEEPSEYKRINKNYYEEKYQDQVIIPWYRIFPIRYYIVTSVLKDKTPSSDFTTVDYGSFCEYYCGKYNLEVLQPNQPLLATRGITKNLNGVRPMATNPGVRRKRGEREETLDEVMIPEFCVKQMFPAVYWYKSVTLITVLHRIHFILLAETIRRRIAFNTMDIFDKSLPKDVNDVLPIDPNCISEKDEMCKTVVPISTILYDVKSARKRRTHPWGDERLHADPKQDLEKANQLKSMVYHDFMSKDDSKNPDPQTTFADPYQFTGENSVLNLEFLEMDIDSVPIPKQSEILRALTLPNGEDIVNLELYKFVGQAFLKFAATFYLNKLYPDMNVFQLRFMRKKLIGKRNLFYCSCKLELASMIKMQHVMKNSESYVSGFQLPDILFNLIKNREIDPDVIFKIIIPKAEKYSGVISSATRNNIQDQLLSHQSNCCKANENILEKEILESNVDLNHFLMYFGKQNITDEQVANSLCALVGVYMINCGVGGGFKFLQFINIVKPDICIKDILIGPKCWKKEPIRDFEFVSDVQNIIEYTFQNETLLKTVFTHHSCSTSTDSNQKLALLGDSILELLITSFIYEHYSNYSMNEMQDFHIALLNDILFSIILVRKGLHKFLVVESMDLFKEIDKFVSQQERVGHELNFDELLYLVEETGGSESKADVPKALPDIFKALIAAIFLDTNGDLSTVWKVTYKLLEKEIDEFSNNIPRNSVKLLAETDLNIEYSKSIDSRVDPNLIDVSLRVQIDKSDKNFSGCGYSEYNAKTIATKNALKQLSKKYTL